MAFGLRASQLGKMAPLGVAEVIDSYLSLEPVMEPNRLEVSKRLGRPDLDAVDTYDQGRLRIRLLSGELQLLSPCEFTAHLPVGDRWRPVAGVSAASVMVEGRTVPADRRQLMVGVVASRPLAPGAFRAEWLARHGAEWPRVSGIGVHPALRGFWGRYQEFDRAWLHFRCVI